MQANIKEIFDSIQGEGLLVGIKQTFIRFTGCNLNCDYCDTEHEECTLKLSEEELFDFIRKKDSGFISLTGGEPLLQANFIESFLKKYKKYLNKEICLETNGTLPEELRKVAEYVDFISMDIKLQSATGQEDSFEINDEFLGVAPDKTYIKVVYNKDIEEYEIENIITLAQKYEVPLILQPVTPIDTTVDHLEIFDKFYAKYKDVRLIPQTHTILGVM